MMSEMKRPSRIHAWGFAALSATGLGLSAELTRIHLLVHTDPSYHSVCAVSEGINCSPSVQPKKEAPLENRRGDSPR